MVTGFAIRKLLGAHTDNVIMSMRYSPVRHEALDIVAFHIHSTLPMFLPDICESEVETQSQP